LIAAESFGMRFISLLLLATVLLCCSGLSTFACDSICLDSASIDVGIGYRSDQFDWSISGDTTGGNPNILSELTWDDLDISQLQLAGQFELINVPLFEKKVLVQTKLSLGKIWSGTVQDSDYGSDNRTNELSRSVSGADRGMTFDLSGAVGPVFEFEQMAGLRVTPLIGYGFNLQALTMTDGTQISLGGGATSTQILELDSSYTAYWYGPWLGVDVEYIFDNKLTLATSFEYHWVEFFAQADWNLRTDFEHPVSFEHEASGSGVIWNIDGAYPLNDQWLWLFNVTVQDWKATGGTDRTFLADGRVGKTHLNRVDWSSFAVMTGLSYQF